MFYRFSAWPLSSLSDGSMQMDPSLFESCSMIFHMDPHRTFKQYSQKKKNKEKNIYVRLVLQ